MDADIFVDYADRQKPRYTSYPIAPHFAALGAVRLRALRVAALMTEMGAKPPST